MATVTVVPSALTFTAEAGTSVFDAAHQAGLRWPTVCGGKGTCRTCLMQVVTGAENLSSVDKWEREGLDELQLTGRGGDATFRLACQALVAGDVVVRKAGVRTMEETT